MSSMYANTCFRVLDSPPLSAATHMALDKVIVEAHSRGEVPNTLRFLQFKPCALVGLHQNVYLEVNVPYCRDQGIDINRRITGGGSLYWGELELGWEIYASKNTPGIPRKVESMYRLLCEAMAKSLQKLGLAAAYRPVNDIEVGGRKISGTGGTETGESFVFQCSLLVDFDVDEMLKVLRFPVEKLHDKLAKSLGERVTSLGEQLSGVPAHPVIKQAILDGLGETLGYDFSPGELSAGEHLALGRELPYFSSDAWVYGQDGKVVNTIDSLTNYKSPGGLIRIQIRLDEGCQVIKYVMISGDFFAYPARAVQDLESLLKNTPVNFGKITEKITAFFDDHLVEIPGVNANHFATAIEQAVAKARENAMRTPQSGRI